MNKFNVGDLVVDNISTQRPRRGIIIRVDCDDTWLHVDTYKVYWFKSKGFGLYWPNEIIKVEGRKSLAS